MKQTREILISALTILALFAAPAEPQSQALSTAPPGPRSELHESASTFATVDYPGALGTQKAGYNLIDLGPVGGPPGQALFISSNGLISGAAASTDGAMHAVLWYLRRKLDIGARGLGGLNSVAFNVNERGQTVGYAETSSSDPYGEDFCGFKTLGLPYKSEACRPFLWQNAVMTALPTLGGQNGVASWINNRDEIAGWVENMTSDPGCPGPQRFQFKPVIWVNGNVQELPTFGDPNGVAISINDKGQVVGGSGECSLYNQSVLANLQPVHALLWQDGVATDLGSLGGTGHGLGNVATAINNQGQVVGSSDLPGDTANHAFFWTRRIGMQDLGTLAGDIGSGAIGINDRAEVVGLSVDANFNFRAFLWRNGAMTDLNTLVPRDSPLSLIIAISVNFRGEIVGLAVDKNSGDAHAFLATPEQW
jgi:probable HAF family extracellular repeat protein